MRTSVRYLYRGLDTRVTTQAQRRLVPVWPDATSGTVPNCAGGPAGL